MPYRFNCRGCRKNIYVRELATGAQVRCRYCGALNEIPPVTIEETDVPAEEILPLYQENPLGPRDFEKLIVEIKNVFVDNIGPLLGINALGYIPFILLGLFWFVPLMLSSLAEETISPMALVLAFLFMMLLYVIVYPLMSGAMFYLVCAHYLKRPVKLQQCFAASAKRLFEMVGTYLLFGMVTFILAVTVLGIPLSIFLSVSWSLFIAVIMLEDPGIIESLKRSFQLIRDDWWRIFGLILVVLMILGGFMMFFSFIPFIGGIIGGLFYNAVFSIFMALLYFDLRVRKENYSVQDLERELLRLHFS
jgi:hypothetical protein